MKAKLTVRTIQGLTAKEKPFEVFDTETPGFILRVEPTGTMTYYLAFAVDGKRRRFKIGRGGKDALSPEQARDIAKRKAGEVANGLDPQQQREEKRRETTTAQSRTVGGFFEEHYLPFLKTERRSAQKIENRIRGCFGWLFDKPMSELNPFLLMGWRKKQLEAGKSAVTVNRDLADLKSMLSRALELGLIASHPLAKLTPAKADDNSRIRFLAPEEEKRLFRALEQRETDGRAARLRFNNWRRQRNFDPYPEIGEHEFIDHLQPLVVVALNTGLRRGELFSLEWRDIDFLNNRLTVRAAAAKGAKRRCVPLNAVARDVLLRWQRQKKDSALVFPASDGRRLDNISSSWGRLVEKAGIEDFTFHDLRHHFATAALSGGADLVTVSKLLGHGDLKMTLRYAHVTDDSLAAAVDGLLVVRGCQ